MNGCCFRLLEYIFRFVSLRRRVMRSLEPALSRCSNG